MYIYTKPAHTQQRKIIKKLIINTILFFNHLTLYNMVNKVILIGNVGKDPEIKEFDNGNKVANLSLATSETWKDKQGEKQTATEWHNLSVFGNTVGVVEKYVKKGDRLYIEGSIKTRTWESDGVTKYAKDIKVHNLTMLGGTAEKKKSEDLDSINDSLF